MALKGNDLERNEVKAPLILKKDDESIKKNDAKSMYMVIISTLVAVCGSFEFGVCCGYSSPTQTAIKYDLGLSLPEYAIFGSIMTIGAMIGAVSSGLISDSIGRKGAMRVSTVFCIIGWMAVYCARDAFTLDSGRFSVGIGIGVLSYVVPVFVAEIAPKHLRGGLTALNQLMICTGMTVTFIFGAFVTWRTLVFIGVLPCLVLLVGLIFIPESPRWLAIAGYEKEFETALKTLRGGKADISEEAEEIQESIKSLQDLPKARMQDLFGREYIRPIIVGVGLMVLQNFGGYNGISYYASETVVSAGFSSGNLGTIIMGAIQIPITAIGAILMDKAGRKPLLVISALGTFVGCFLAAVSFYMKGQGLYMNWSPILAITGILVYLGFYSIGMGPIPWIIMSEIFPVRMKGIAGSMVVLANWLCSWVLCYAFTFLMSWSSSGTFLIFSVVCASTILFVAKLVPETKGCTLEEIQASMNKQVVRI